MTKSSFCDLQIVHPSLKPLRNSDRIVTIGRSVPFLSSETEIDRLRDEWLS